MNIFNLFFRIFNFTKKIIFISVLQQMCHLREFFIVHHMREKEDKRTHQITIPFFKAQESVLDLTNNKQPHEILVEEVKGMK